MKELFIYKGLELEANINGYATYDKKNIYFYVETTGAITPYTDPNWMVLLIDADKNSSSGWYGYDYMVNKNVPDGETTELMQYNPATETWKPVAKLKYRVAGNRLEVAIFRNSLNLPGNSFVFDFKWCDNPADLKDPISLCIDGDTAPNRRFNYRCIWKK